MYLVIALAIVFTTNSANAAGENGREFGDMCALYRLLIQPIAEPKLATSDGSTSQTITDELTTLKEKIVKLNLTVLEPQMEKVLRDKENYGTANKILAADSKVKDYFTGLSTDIVSLMIAQYPKTQTGDQADKDFITKFKLPLTEQKRQALRKAMKALTDKGLQTARSVETLATAITNSRIEARRALITALYGISFAEGVSQEVLGAESNFNDIPQPAKFPWGNNNDRDTTCAEADGKPAKAGNTLATDMVCLCVSDNSGNVDACGDADIGADAEISAGTAQAAAQKHFTALTTECKKQAETTPKLTATSLSTAIAGFYGQLGKNARTDTTAPIEATSQPHKRHNYYGIFVFKNSQAPTCRSATFTLTTQATGHCIDYTALLTKNKQIPWIAKLSEAETAMDKIKEEFHQASVFLTEMTGVTTQMESLLLIGDLFNQAKSSVPGTDKNTQLTTEEEIKCKAATNKTADQCKELDCDHDPAANKCKPKQTGTETSKEINHYQTPFHDHDRK
ncbi:Trypanosomal VSG domain containing protein [Trypanosoma brucei equiperdum]|uniref:Trypanosomal VSG domain containing protein n=1 Tax=Trypanosoma brucei equiperdum TaxID=630700 RepID=A0A3L6KVL5_9TRYP|nr:Trypanosomal VSG domain containing protein [Trypanosoma brucei equiperdum]